MQLTGSQVIIECLKEQGVDTVFGYPGGAILNVYDELYKHPEIKHVLTSHEQGASHAADGYARASGKTGHREPARPWAAAQPVRPNKTASVSWLHRLVIPVQFLKGRQIQGDEPGAKGQHQPIIDHGVGPVAQVGGQKLHIGLYGEGPGQGGPQQERQLIGPEGIGKDDDKGRGDGGHTQGQRHREEGPHRPRPQGTGGLGAVSPYPAHQQDHHAHHVGDLLAGIGQDHPNPPGILDEQGEGVRGLDQAHLGSQPGKEPGLGQEGHPQESGHRMGDGDGQAQQQGIRPFAGHQQGAQGHAPSGG